MIVTFTDFGWQGSYIGQMEAVLRMRAPQVQVVHLQKDAPTWNPRAAACLLAHLVGPFPAGTVFLCVVDPGVGTARRPIILQTPKAWWVGPDNGLMMPAARAQGLLGAWMIPYPETAPSVSFHGRDLFAPAAAGLARGEDPAGDPIALASLVGRDWSPALREVIYVDAYGNLVTGIPGGDMPPSARIGLKGHRIPYARVFGEARPGEPFWYVNSMGLVEVAIRCASAASRLHAGTGTGVVVEGLPGGDADDKGA
ncbi:SAM hydrolase/SAM-dependent halogenase family protein [Ectothiorhodospira mobilis]|uniref:SAM hydrolase/SAM-dependent halogenase family protein n=1 Tax=Ectothiorhodospira mobilis TaxID=195064 RepID=UPI0019049301|nr:SAM-dependent chlorinase/fluorinase [Ectothiorhodospira mobilis]MBK1691405.1 hypothetical protein [Ectothiorhodospira mobilis]